MKNIIGILLLCTLLLPVTGVCEEAALPDFSEKFAEKFLPAGEVLVEDMRYQSDSVSIVITKDRRDRSDYYVADIYVRDLSSMRHIFAGKKWDSEARRIDKIAKEHDAILALTGDYAHNLPTGIVFFNGTIYREKMNNQRDLCFITSDGVMETYLKGSVKAEDILKKDIWQSFLFGPMLIDEGNAMTKFNTNVHRANPRAAIGYFEPGHYCFVVVDGRSSKNLGMTLTQLSQLMVDLGCQTAYNLDGGQSAALCFNGAVINAPYNGGRPLNDIVCITDQPL